MGELGLGVPHRGPALCRFSFSNPEALASSVGSWGCDLRVGTLQVGTSCQLELPTSGPWLFQSPSVLGDLILSCTFNSF